MKILAYLAKNLNIASMASSLPGRQTWLCSSVQETVLFLLPVYLAFFDAPMALV